MDSIHATPFLPDSAATTPPDWVYAPGVKTGGGFNPGPKSKVGPGPG